MERCNDSYVSDKFQKRSNDIVWRIQLQNPDDSKPLLDGTTLTDSTNTTGKRWCYLYLLIEFQSTSDYWMPVRILAYTALLWQSLIERGELKMGKALPPVLPIVIYNGGKTWKAKTNIGDLLSSTHDILQKYQPSQEYFLLDENIFKEEHIQRKRGFTALLLKLDRAKTPEAVHEVAQILIAELRRPEYESLRKLFMSVLSVATQEYLNDTTEVPHQKLTEAYSMLAENIQNMVHESHVKGIELGRVEGRGEGTRNTIINIATMKWGSLSHNLLAKLGCISDIELLEMMTRELFYAQSLQEFESIVENTVKRTVQ